MDSDHDPIRQRVLFRSRQHARRQERRPAAGLPLASGEFGAAAQGAPAILPGPHGAPGNLQYHGVDGGPEVGLNYGLNHGLNYGPSQGLADTLGVSSERLRRELEISSFNESTLLAPFAYLLIAFDGAILQVNLAGAAMLGISRAYPGGQRFRALVTHPFQPDFDAVFARAINSVEPISCRVRMRRAGHGDAFQVTLHASADAGGQACRMLIEPAEGALAALMQHEERYRRIVHSADAGIWEVDASATTTFVNPRMASMLGYSIEEVLARPLGAFMDDEGRAMMDANIARRRQGLLERHECKFIRKDGHAIWTSLTTQPIFDAGGAYIGAVAQVSDMTARRESTALIWRQANYDALTGLPNRHMFMDRLGLDIKKADRSAGFLALLFIDLDHFKQCNDRLGHARGDQVLSETSRRIASCIRSSDTLARLGGDEFTVILAGLDHVGSVERIARQMLSILALPFDLDGEKAFISASIGIALYPPDGAQLERLVDCADQAMYAAKHAGGNAFRYFTPDLQEAALLRQNMAGDLREALRLGQFEIVYQPIVALRTGAVHQAEALLRWRHPVRGLLGPAEFIPFAESNGLIVEIGDWVFRQVAQQALRWQASIGPQFQVCVNKSPVQFRHDAALYKNWLDYLNQLGLPPRSIVIEITESVLLDGADEVIERLRQFRAMGLQVALDDFGTGYASLSHLKRFAIDYVKIDQSFVATLEDDLGDLALCEAIIAMAHKLGLKVVAEGVETKVQRALLVDAGCDYAQGYIFARPMAAAALESMALESRAMAASSGSTPPAPR